MDVNQDSQVARPRGAKLERAVRRKQIAGTALELIARDGLQGLSIARITGALGLVPAAFYRHFESKDEVVDAVLDLVRDRLLANVRKARRASTDPLEQLKQLLDLHLALVRQHPGIPRLVFSEQLFASPSKERIRGIITAYLDRLSAIIASGQAAGKVRRDRCPQALATMFLGLIQPAVLLQSLTGGEFNMARHAAEAWPLFREMLLPPLASGGETR